MADALVSIIIPVRNRAELLEQAIVSLTVQTYSNWEAVVVDDESNAVEYSRIASVAVDDPRIHIIRNSHRRGAPGARNAGYLSSRGPFIIFLDSDDLLAPTCLDRRVDQLESNSKLDFAVFLTAEFNETPADATKLWNDFTPEDDLTRFLRQDMPWATAGPIWRREAIARVGLWYERARGWQDWEFHIRALAAGLRYQKVRICDSYWRTTRDKSISNTLDRRREVLVRVRTLQYVATATMATDDYKPVYRRLLAAQFFRHAFQSSQSYRQSRLIWRAALSSRVIGRLQFYFGLAWTIIFRISNRILARLARMITPELRSIQRGTHLKLLIPPAGLRDHLKP